MALFELIHSLNFPDNQYLIVGGGLMEALGIRATNDLDIVVTKELFSSCSNSGKWKESITTSGRPTLERNLPNSLIEKIGLYLDVNTPTFQPTTEELLERSQLINGCRFLSIPDLIAFKKAYNRPKDQRDLILLRAYQLMISKDSQ